MWSTGWKPVCFSECEGFEHLKPAELTFYCTIFYLVIFSTCLVLVDPLGFLIHFTFKNSFSYSEKLRDITINEQYIYILLMCVVYSEFLSFKLLFFFFVPGTQSRQHVLFNCHVSWSSPDYGFSQTFLVIDDLTVLWNTGILKEVPLLEFGGFFSPLQQEWVVCNCEEYGKGKVIFHHSILRYMLLAWPMITDVGLGPLDEVLWGFTTVKMFFLFLLAYHTLFKGVTRYSSHVRRRNSTSFPWGQSCS